MTLEDVEWTLVKRLVIDDLVSAADPYNVLRLYFPDDVPHWRVTQVATENADLLVETAKRSQLSDDHPFSIRLLETLARLDTIRTQKPDDLTRLRQFLDRLTAEKAALRSEDHFGVTVLPFSGEAFIDRKPVRGSLRRLVEPGGGPQPIALFVTGEKDSGKSFTYSLIRHLAQPYRFVPLKVLLSPTTTAEDMLRDFRVLINTKRRPDAVPDPAKRRRYWAQWLVAEARRAYPDQPCWFVIDQGNELDPNSDAVDFIAHLADAISETGALPNAQPHRLVLLGWSRDPAELFRLPPKQILLPEYISPINEDDLREFFEQQFRRAPDDADGAEQDEDWSEYVDIAVRHVIDDAQQARRDGGCYMRAIASATQGVLDEFSNA
ncbi:MAG TPA: hypothetical protein VFU35_09090 [Jatrophihabitans sp.]|nr:hypothetical protein [Jatrophihabitans sp.]